MGKGDNGLISSGTETQWNGAIYCQDSKDKTACKNLFIKYCTNKGANAACKGDKKCFRNFQKLCFSNPHVYKTSNGAVYCKNKKDNKCLNDFKDICDKNYAAYCKNTKHPEICVHKFQNVCFSNDSATQSSSQDTQIGKYCKGSDDKDKCLGTFRKICNNSKYFCQFMKSDALKNKCIQNFKNVCKHDSSSQYYDTYSDSSTQSFSGTGSESKGPYHKEAKTETEWHTSGMHGKIGNAHVWLDMIRHFSGGTYCKHLDGDKNKECLARFARVCAQRLSHCNKSADQKHCIKAFENMCFNTRGEAHKDVIQVLKAKLKEVNSEAKSDSETQSSYSDSSYDSDSQTSDDSSYDSSY